MITAAVTALIGVALLVHGVLGGLWPLSAQPIAGVLFIILGWVRWRTLS